jgi:hypothetical protein
MSSNLIIFNRDYYFGQRVLPIHWTTVLLHLSKLKMDNVHIIVMNVSEKQITHGRVKNSSHVYYFASSSNSLSMVVILAYTKTCVPFHTTHRIEITINTFF